MLNGFGHDDDDDDQPSEQGAGGSGGSGGAAGAWIYDLEDVDHSSGGGGGRAVIRVAAGENGRILVAVRDDEKGGGGEESVWWCASGASRFRRREENVDEARPMKKKKMMTTTTTTTTTTLVTRRKVLRRVHGLPKIGSYRVLSMGVGGDHDLIVLSLSVGVEEEEVGEDGERGESERESESERRSECWRWNHSVVGPNLGQNVPFQMDAKRVKGGEKVEKEVETEEMEENGILRNDGWRGRVASVACGPSHDVLLTLDGEVYVTGSNLRGQLGVRTPLLADNPDSPSPSLSLFCSLTKIHHLELLSGLPGVVVVAVSCGSHHTAALTSSHDLYMWGTLSTSLSGKTHDHYDGSSSGMPVAHRWSQQIPTCFLVEGEEEDPPIMLASTSQWVVVRTRSGRVVVVSAQENELVGTVVGGGGGGGQQQSFQQSLCGSPLFHCAWSTNVSSVHVPTS